MGCGCGSKTSSGKPRRFQHIDASGKVVKTYTSEMDARSAVSRSPGSRLRPVG